YFSTPMAWWNPAPWTAANSAWSARSRRSGRTAIRRPSKSSRLSFTRSATSPGTCKWTIGPLLLSRSGHQPVRNRVHVHDGRGLGGSQIVDVLVSREPREAELGPIVHRQVAPARMVERKGIGRASVVCLGA